MTSKRSTKWTRQQLLVALTLYCELEFGQLHGRNPRIIRVAEAIGRTPSALAMKLSNFASLDPVITSTGRAGLRGASASDRAIWLEMQHDMEEFTAESEQAMADSGLGPKLPIPAVQEEGVVHREGEDRPAQAKIRIGQSFFRKTVLTVYNGRCCISGLAVPQLLVASHIVPWSVDPDNRLNPSNGLCLSALHDRAFDVGLLTIGDDMTVMTSSKVAGETGSFYSKAINSYAGKQIEYPAKFPPDRDFLAYHRERVFKK